MDFLTATLVITENCNLSCKYCYQKGISSRCMTSAIGKKTIDWLINYASRKKVGIAINFHGGEPLLEFKLIQEVVSYAESHSFKKGINFRFSITTNGTLINKEITSFLKEKNFQIILSCDGEQTTHDLFRTDKYGVGSFSSVDRSLNLLLARIGEKRVNVNATISPTTAEMVAHNAKYLYRRGVRTLSFTYDRNANWEETNFGSVEEAHYRLGDFYLDCFKKGQPLNIDCLNNRISNSISRNTMKPRKYLCGAGRDTLGIDAAGNILPCHRFAGRSDGNLPFRMGHVSTKALSEIPPQLKGFRRSELIGCDITCRECKYQRRCISGCVYVNIINGRNPFLNSKDTRYFEIIWQEVTEAIIETAEKGMI